MNHTFDPSDLIEKLEPLRGSPKSDLTDSVKLVGTRIKIMHDGKWGRLRIRGRDLVTVFSGSAARWNGSRRATDGGKVTNISSTLSFAQYPTVAHDESPTDDDEESEFVKCLILMDGITRTLVGNSGKAFMKDVSTGKANPLARIKINFKTTDLKPKVTDFYGESTRVDINADNIGDEIPAETIVNVLVEISSVFRKTMTVLCKAVRIVEVAEKEDTSADV